MKFHLEILYAEIHLEKLKTKVKKYRCLISEMVSSKEDYVEFNLPVENGKKPITISLPTVYGKSGKLGIPNPLCKLLTPTIIDLNNVRYIKLGNTSNIGTRGVGNIRPVVLGNKIFSVSDVTQHGVLTMFDVITETITYFNLQIYSTEKGFYGIMSDGQNIYATPGHNNGARSEGVKYNPVNENRTGYNTAVGNSLAKGFAGGTLVNDRYLYMNPYYLGNGNYSGIVAIMDTTDGSFTYIDLTNGNPDAKGYHDSVFDGRYLYMIPYYTGHSQDKRLSICSVIDTVDNSVEYLNLSEGNDGASGFFGGTLIGEYIYLAPYHNGDEIHGLVAKINTVTREVGYIDMTTLDNKLKGFTDTVNDGRYVYLVPNNNGQNYSGLVGIIDTKDNDKLYMIDLKINNNLASGYYGAVVENGNVYFLPRYNESGYHGLMAIIPILNK